MTSLLRLVSPNEVRASLRPVVDDQTLAEAGRIVKDVEQRGESALREHAERLGDLTPGAPLFIERAALDRALAELPERHQALLLRTAERIRDFAGQQLQCLQPMTCTIPGGQAGHWLAPLERAGCYSPGGRFPLPSSVLMTAITARTAGVDAVWVASPRPAPITLAAAAVARADGLLAVGGAQAVAALAFGTSRFAPCDAVVGPGNRWVTAAKQLLAGKLAIDMLAGPSELVVLADRTANARVVAADLLAQAEHDPDALPILVTLDADLVERVEEQLARQLTDLPTAANARAALRNGYAVVATDVEQAIQACDQLAPEHLEVFMDDAQAVALRLKHYGGLFIGGRSAEVLGDYGAGPNHVLPTSATARFTGGLSVFNFLRIRTWLRIDDPEGADQLTQDAAELARLEGLQAHARAAEARLKNAGWIGQKSGKG